jgi:septum formation protein
VDGPRRLLVYDYAMKVLLASGSPRRRELLTTVGLLFQVVLGGEIDEARVLDELRGPLSIRLIRLAQLKGDSVAQSHPDAVVISADTVVELEGELLGKPADVDEARRMLDLLSGRTHQVHTAVVVQHAAQGVSASGVESTRVSFNLLDSQTIDTYIARDEPFDKAGAYAIQGIGALLVRRIEGDYTNVVGLPLGLTARLLLKAGIRIL